MSARDVLLCMAVSFAIGLTAGAYEGYRHGRETMLTGTPFLRSLLRRLGGRAR